MKLSAAEIEQAIKDTQNAKFDLETNYNYMNNTVMPYLSEWKDHHVEEFFDIQNLFNSYTKVTMENMDKATETLRTLLEMVNRY